MGVVDDGVMQEELPIARQIVVGTCVVIRGRIVGLCGVEPDSRKCRSKVKPVIDQYRPAPHSSMPLHTKHF